MIEVSIQIGALPGAKRTEIVALLDRFSAVLKQPEKPAACGFFQDAGGNALCWLIRRAEETPRAPRRPSEPL